MQDRPTTSWRRRSDTSASSDENRVAEQSASSMRAKAEKLEAWEDEGGSTGNVSSDVLRVLIVDNDMRSADSLELMLNAAGYIETRVAYSAHAALAFAAEFRPDVAFLEMNLIDMDSNELAQRLRERAQIHDLRLIAMTSSRAHAGRDVARNAGFERYLLKPIATADLSTLLDVQPQRGSISEDRAPRRE
jgi:PleD family two-component response regulator